MENVNEGNEEVIEEVIEDIIEEAADVSEDSMPVEFNDDDTLTEVLDAIEEVQEDVQEIREEITTHEENETWEKSTLEAIQNQMMSLTQAMTGMQTTLAEMMLSQNQLITDTIAQLKQPAPDHTSPESQAEITQTTQPQDSAILGKSGQAVEEVTEAIKHPVVHQEPAKPKRNWI